jgi:DNA-binding MarR family transcriptional regulator
MPANQNKRRRDAGERVRSVAPRKTYDLTDRLPFLINRVGGAMVDFAAAGLKHFHLSIPLWRILAALAHRGEMRQVDLVGAVSLDPPTVSRLITGAVKKGFVTRTRSDKNNREVVVRLTRKGREVVEDLVPKMLADEEVAFGNLPAKDIALVKTVLRRMYQNIAEHRAHAGPYADAAPMGSRSVRPRRAAREP